MIGLILLALSVSSGVLLNIFSCIIYETWLPLFIMFFAVFSLIPVLLCVAPEERGLDIKAADVDFFYVGWFVAGTLVTSVFAFPVMLVHLDILPIGPIIMNLLGSACIYFTIILFAHSQLGYWNKANQSPF